MPLPALAAVAKAAAPMLKKAALKAAKKKAVSTAMNAMRPKEEEQKSMKKEYRDGGRKPLKKLKGAIQKANYKAGEVKNRLEKKVLDAVKRKKAEKGMKYKNGGRKPSKVKGLLAGLEALPSKNAGRAKKKLPKNMSEVPGYDFQATSKLFKDNLRKIASQSNKAMEKATGLKGGMKPKKKK